MLPFHRILCPTDFSEGSVAALEEAVELVRDTQAALLVLHVMAPPQPVPPDLLLMGPTGWDDEEIHRQVKDCLLDFVADHVPPGTEVRNLIAEGDAATEIVRCAQEEGADLIVIATHGLTGWRHLVFGSVTETVVRRAPCPVLTTHGKVRVSA